ncbi:hypothetical protein [Kingella sp. (in: b-proteobacteria)]|uniref:hypothetical protein n=1 Tax=Kingella sp. (in: b-proteobacteria) TaxID=2020713 RepID=UPI0026DD370E|nr:hypothetical protein [Kingella sp. (in: b-proteobacteria)]MDO4656250.1 hypothetical protein [Kingella sp. (in: b-proteobacteria)]
MCSKREVKSLDHVSDDKIEKMVRFIKVMLQNAKERDIAARQLQQMFQENFGLDRRVTDKLIALAEWELEQEWFERTQS